MTPHVPLDRVLTAVRSVHRQKETAVSAPEPSVAEQAVIDRFGIFDPEEAVEKVARAIWECHPGAVSWDELSPRTPTRTEYRRLATVAIAAMPAHPAEAALRQRIEHLIDPETGMAWPLHGDRVFRERDIRAAIAAPQTGQRPTDEEGR